MIWPLVEVAKYAIEAFVLVYVVAGLYFMYKRFNS